MSLLGSIGSAIGGIAGPLVSGAIGMFGQQSTNVANAKQAQQAEAFSAAEAEKARQFNASQADLNRQFQDKESSTAWQRGVADIKAAGLNPALAYGQGGASSPVGSTASSSSPSGQMARMDSSAGAGISSAVAAAQAIQSVETQAAQRDQIHAQTASTLEQANLNKEQAATVAAMRAHTVDEMLARGQSEWSARDLNWERGRQLREQMPYFADLMRSEFERNVASAGQARAQAGVLGTQKSLLDYSIPAAANASAAAQTVWGRSIAPYLNDAKSVSSMFFPWSKFLPSVGGP